MVATRMAVILFLIFQGLIPKDDETTPMLVTDRALERTGFQEAGPYGPRFDLRTDLIMAYGVDPKLKERMDDWAAAGYGVHLMTGVAWGNYQDYLKGEFDGREHWDEGQVDAAGKPVDHGPTVPYMVPAVSFSDYLEEGLKRVIDAGVEAVHLEEPEFWAKAGFSESFKREWRIFYNEPWQRPDGSCDAQYRASRLKYYLYQRMLNRLCASLKEYALVKHNRKVRFYVPTHSLLNYTQWKIVSPLSSLIDLAGIDGYIAQVWTGTARTPNQYHGKRKERTFETAYLEYGIMQELVRGTGRRMWFLNDPIEDYLRRSWDDYRKNYICTLVASLLHPRVWHYEVAPWPKRVFQGRYPKGDPEGTPIPKGCATTLAVVFNQLRDMKQEEVSHEGAVEGVGVFLGDAAMFQRAEPAFSEGVSSEEDDQRPTAKEVRDFSGFYGLALPPLKRGIPIRPVQLENTARFPGYLDTYKVLLLSYEFMKPMTPGINLAIAQWVKGGGSLINVGADRDPFHQVRAWWNRPPRSYASPREHLFELLDLEGDAGSGRYECGKGLLLVDRVHPAFYSRSKEGAERLIGLVKQGLEAAGGEYRERNAFLLRRGPYIIAACLEESISTEPLRIEGLLIDLLDPELPVKAEAEILPGQQAWFLDLKKVKGEPPMALAAAGRLEKWYQEEEKLEYTLTSPQGIEAVTRILITAPPKSITVNGRSNEYAWHDASKTVLIQHDGEAEGVEVVVEW